MFFLHDWKHLISLLNTKFFCAETEFTLAKLGTMRQYLREDLDAYVKMLHETNLDCCNLVAEDVLVDVCLYGLIEDYRIYMENLSFSSISWVMQAARRTNWSVITNSRPSSLIRSSSVVRCAPKKRPINATVKKGKGAKVPSEKISHRKKRLGNFQFYHSSMRRKRPELS